ncbi:MAG: response regulator, partial [Ktedonobacteraceae bacterium]
SVLWVDDRPENQQYERNALKALGIRFTASLSTEEALAKLRRKKYDAIISDMGRPPDAQAGYTLLQNLPELNKDTPFMIYSFNGSLPEHRQEAARRGAYGSTDQIQELFGMVLEALQQK